MKRLVVVLLALLLSGCSHGPDRVGGGLDAGHDPVHHVTCWGWAGEQGIACLPDSEIVQP